MIALGLLVLILTRIEAAWLSPLRPLTALEREVPLWPPTVPLLTWLERVLIAPWARWDALWYARIVAHGYQAGDGTTQFYPLYPLLAMPLARLGVPPLTALTVVGLAAGLGAVLRSNAWPGRRWLRSGRAGPPPRSCSSQPLSFSSRPMPRGSS